MKSKPKPKIDWRKIWSFPYETATIGLMIEWWMPESRPPKFKQALKRAINAQLKGDK